MFAMSKCIAAYDFGTSGVKAALVDQRGNLITAKERPYALLRPAPAYVEQDPNEYWSAVCGATKDALLDSGTAPEDVAGLSFSSQEQNIIPVDRDGNILYNAISWLDSRAVKQAEEINEKLGVPALRSQDFYSRLLWLKQNEPSIYEKSEYFHYCNSFLKYKATGVKVASADSPAVVKFPPPTEAMIDAVYELAGLDKSKVPPMLNACMAYAGLDAKAAKELGLAEGTPVFGGSVDVAGAAAGAGCLKEGDAHVYFGSSGWLSAIVGESAETTGDGLYILPSVIPGLFIYGGCINSCCMLLDWAINKFYGVEKARPDVYDIVNAEAESVPPGSDGLMAGPWLEGEQCPINDPFAGGVFFNMRAGHNRGDFIKAIYESICYSMKWQVEYYEKDSGRTIGRIGANGGGSLSNTWMQSLSDVLQIPVYVPAHSRHSGAIGAALSAAIGLGFINEQELSSFITVEREFYPRREYAGLYADRYQKFKKLYSASKELFAELNAQG